MKKLKLFLLTLLLAAMVLSLAGCKKDAPVETETLGPLDESILLPEVEVDIS